MTRIVSKYAYFAQVTTPVVSLHLTREGGTVYA